MRLVPLLPTCLMGLAILGLAPGFLLRVIVRLYPPGHPRRRELVAELYTIGYKNQLLFVVQQLELAISEGIPERWRSLQRSEPNRSSGLRRPSSASYRGPQVCSIVGITFRQLDYWSRTHLIRPSITDAGGGGPQRRYSYRDLVEAKLIKSMLDAGVALRVARRAMESLREDLGKDIASASLVVSGTDSVVLVRDTAELVELIREGRGVINVMTLDRVKADVDAAIVDLRVG